ncbi:hypothetical protein P4133_33840 [Pseudomonas aeruginosa]|nr:hypothetical protein [Pseudomonas aeruginosa]
MSPASLYKLQQLSDGRLLALGFGGTLLASQDQGLSWQVIPLPVRAGLYGAAQLADGSLLLTGQVAWCCTAPMASSSKFGRRPLRRLGSAWRKCLPSNWR